MFAIVLKESDKSRFDSYGVRNSVLIISHITLGLPFGTIACTLFSVRNQRNY